MKRASNTLPEHPNKRSMPLPASTAESTTPLPFAKLAIPPPSASPRPPPFQQPAPLLTFSYNASHELTWDDSSRRYYVDPPPGANLNHRYEQWVRRSDDRGRIDSLLRAYDRARAQADPAKGNVEAGALCWRGVMTKILIAPYETRDGHALNVMLLNGTLYLEEHLTAEKLVEKNDMAPRQRLMTYYGYAFEGWCTADAPAAAAGWGGDVDTNVQWCQVVKTKLGATRLVMGGEVDCVRAGGGEMVELKTSMAIRGAQDEARFEKKLLKFYMQSFLLGVPEIVVGFRTPQGYLKTVQSFKTLHLPRMVRGKPDAWDAQLSRQLSTGGQGDSAAQVWRLTFTPGEGVSLGRLDAEGVRDVEGGEDRIGFLPRWYWEQEAARASANLPSEDVPQPAAGSADGERTREASEVVSQPVVPSATNWKI